MPSWDTRTSRYVRLYIHVLLSLCVRVHGLVFVHLGLSSGFSSTIVGCLHIAVDSDHFFFLVVVSSLVTCQQWTSVVSIGGSLAIVVYAQGKHYFSMFWNIVLPRWNHTQDKPYVLLILDRNSIRKLENHSPSTKACHVVWMFFRPRGQSLFKAFGAPQSMLLGTQPRFCPSHSFFLVWLVRALWNKKSITNQGQGLLLTMTTA